VHAGDDRSGLIAIIAGTCFIAWTGIFFRFTELGPITTAAWRLIIAVPALMVWMRVLNARSALAGTRRPIARPWRLLGPVLLAGLAFASDVACFHLSLKGTSITNASFIGNIAPILTVVGGTLFFAEHPDRRVWLALLLALFGSWIMAGMVAPGQLNSGDVWALGAAVAYCGYLLFIKQLRLQLDGPSATMWSAVASAVVLTIAALILEPQFFPTTLIGWAVVLAIGLGSHAMGQGLTSIAMGRVPVGVVATVILAQPPVSAFLAWALLGEAINIYQMCGASIIIAALVIGRPR
jgi:drug/metabolite transporter (DMT)-like permease